MRRATKRGLSLPIWLDEKLVEAAREQRRPLSWVAVDALKLYLQSGTDNDDTKEREKDD